MPTLHHLHAKSLLHALLTEDRIVPSLCLHLLLRKLHDVAYSPERSKSWRESLQEEVKILSLELLRHRWAFVLDNVRERIFRGILSHIGRNLGVEAEQEESNQ